MLWSLLTPFVPKSHQSTPKKSQEVRNKDAWHKSAPNFSYRSLQFWCVQRRYVLAVSSAHVNSRMQLYAGAGGVHPHLPIPFFSLLSETELGEKTKYVTAVTLMNRAFSRAILNFLMYFCSQFKLNFNDLQLTFKSSGIALYKQYTAFHDCTDQHS